jgi:ABC-type sulfate/molybdate transport systems ATPase subunit
VTRYLAPQPRLLLLDEPFSNLDARVHVRVVAQHLILFARSDA